MYYYVLDKENPEKIKDANQTKGKLIALLDWLPNYNEEDILETQEDLIETSNGWVKAGEAKKSDNVLIENSIDTMSSEILKEYYKKELESLVKAAASEIIYDRYPQYKQINLSMLPEENNGRRAFIFFRDYIVKQCDEFISRIDTIDVSEDTIKNDLSIIAFAGSQILHKYNMVYDDNTENALIDFKAVLSSKESKTNHYELNVQDLKVVKTVPKMDTFNSLCCAYLIDEYYQRYKMPFRISQNDSQTILEMPVLDLLKNDDDIQNAETDVILLQFVKTYREELVGLLKDPNKYVLRAYTLRRNSKDYFNYKEKQYLYDMGDFYFCVFDENGVNVGMEGISETFVGRVNIIDEKKKYLTFN